MAEYIKREDAEKKLTEIVFEEPPYMDTVARIEKYSKDEMAELPSIEIIFCKNCESYHGMWCALYDHVRFDDDFCSYGRRKEQEHE